MKRSLALAALLAARPACALDPLFVAAEYRELIEDLTMSYLPLLRPGMTAAWVHTESGWRRNAVSSAGARGPLQIMPGTAEVIRVSCRMPELDLTNMVSALKGGFCYGAQVRRKIGHMASVADENEAMFRAYNGGPGYILKERAAASGDGLNDRRAANLTAYCRAFRGETACRENLAYYPTIVRRHRKHYGSW